MKKCIYILCSLNLLFSLGCTIRNTTNKLIKVPVPERVEGQADVLELTAPKLDTVRVGFIGLGMRGISAVERFIHIPGTKIVALCDIRPECVDKSQKVLIDAGLPKAVTYTGNEEAWKKLCERNDIGNIMLRWRSILWSKENMLL